MKLHRLQVHNFAVIRDANLAFGPGLNVLYGPNDLGKSTLADAIRLALLLPHTSTHYNEYMPWSEIHEAVVELTFQTEDQRFWRIRKQFGRGGSSQLEESRNGLDFDNAERGRGVDAKLREILGWGIPEPGGGGAGKGLPTSFLATALLSTQAEVTDVLDGSLDRDPIASGKERIASALQAVAQDPLFVALLREAQARRDEAYTDKGAKKTARGSVFKAAADRLKEARDEKERLQKIAEESEGVEERLRTLTEQRWRVTEQCAAATERLATVERLAEQAAQCSSAAEQVRIARNVVVRIQQMDHEVAEAERKVAQLTDLKDHAEHSLNEAQTAEAIAVDELNAAEEAARSIGLDSDLANTVASQSLELRRIAADRAAQEAQQSIDAATAAQRLVDEAIHADQDHRNQKAEAICTREKLAEATETEQAAERKLRVCDLLELAWETRAAEQRVASARADVEREAALKMEWTRVREHRTAAAERRAAIVVPLPGSLAAMRKLANDLASGRGALEVGLVMTVTPAALVDVEVRKDGVAADRGVIAEPLEIEANAEVEVRIAQLASVRVQGGRREAQDRLRSLEERWNGEVLPHLAAAGVVDLDTLEAKVVEARELDSRVNGLEGDLEALGHQIAALANAAETLRHASAHAAACHLALGDASLETLAADLDALGPDPRGAIRMRRQQALRDLEAARTTVHEAATGQVLAEEREQNLLARIRAAAAARDAVLATFAFGVAAGASAAEESLQASLTEQEDVKTELATLQSTIDVRRQQCERVIGGAREVAGKARSQVEAARESCTNAIRDLASEERGLAELLKLRLAADFSAAERASREAAERHDALPVPERSVTFEEVAATRNALAEARRSFDTIDRDVHIAQGALQQVGGAVARDRLRDAAEAFDLAERQETETEADYEAWRLLLEQMKEADAEQASNLGQVLAPAIADRFRALTQQRYESIQLTAQLGTDGVVVAGEVRPPDRISVGTREQLSTLYRLCLGEYLQTTIVLDDQLVQSDPNRMDWFRILLAERARSFQIVVFTCRPDDYLAAAAMVPDGLDYLDTDEGFVRAIDLSRAVH